MSDIQLYEGENSLAALLKRPEYSRRFEAVLGERAAQFASSLINIGSTMRDVEPRSIIGSAMIAAALDLPIDKNLGFAWIVPYRKEGKKMASFQLGYRGLIQLAQRSSQYARMNATAINQEVFQGYDEVGEPKLDWDQYDPTKPSWGYFFGFQLVNGFTKKAVWSKEKVLEHARRYSKAYQQDADIWKSQFEGMAIKTVISNTLRKWGPLSVQLQQALRADQTIIKDVGAEPVYPDDVDEIQQPVLEHPEVKKQREAKEAAKVLEVKAEPAPTPVVEKAPEPAPVEQPVPAPVPEPTPAPVATTPESAPTPAPASTPEPQPEGTISPFPIPEKENAPAPGLTESQARLAGMVGSLKSNFEEFVAWGMKAIPFMKAKPPSRWQDISDQHCEFFVKNQKGVRAGLDEYRRNRNKK